MTRPVAENPAVLDPRKALTPAQQDALCCIGFYRHARYSAGYWRIGRKRFTAATVYRLNRMELISGGVFTPPALTTAGRLAADRLQGRLQ